MPLPEKYLRQLAETHAAAERAARKDYWRAWVRVLGEIAFSSLLGLALIGLAFHAWRFELGIIYWYAGCIVWIGGVSTAILTAYRRGEERGDW
ncbi:MAG TPA: hypothetical protein VKA54_04380 [Gemmatimonadaceae bacterium]|nr:hypothetical protein [Gemmatimonadaceae bacterium]